MGGTVGWLGISSKKTRSLCNTVDNKMSYIHCIYTCVHVHVYQNVTADIVVIGVHVYVQVYMYTVM